MTPISLNEYIVADSSICHGKPTFKGTRIMVWQILDMLASGVSHQEVFDAFPGLEPRHIQAALHYASSLTRENYVIVNTSAALSH